MRFGSVSFAAGVALQLFLVTSLAAQVKRDRVLADRLVELGQQQRIGILVEMLASKNAAPEGKYGDLTYPKNYDKSKQAIIYLAIQQLLGEGSAAFDILINHVADKRHSYVDEAGNGEWSVSVGDVCVRIMARNINCYECEIYSITMDQDKIDPWWGKEFVDWLKANKQRPLYELQTESIDRAIKFFETVDREKASTPHPEMRNKMPVDEFERKRKENLRILRSMRASINANNQPYRPRTIDNEGGSMRDLPWPTRVIGR
jgi:hypothetical protein